MRSGRSPIAFLAALSAAGLVLSACSKNTDEDEGTPTNAAAATTSNAAAPAANSAAVAPAAANQGTPAQRAQTNESDND